MNTSEGSTTERFSVGPCLGRIPGLTEDMLDLHDDCSVVGDVMPSDVLLPDHICPHIAARSCVKWLADNALIKIGNKAPHLVRVCERATARFSDVSEWPVPMEGGASRLWAVVRAWVETP